MQYKIISVPAIEPKEAIEILNRELSELNFSPNIGFIIFTTRYYGKHQPIMKYLKNVLRFETVTFFAEAFGTKEGIFIDGILLIVMKLEYRIFKTQRGDLRKQLSRIAEEIKGYDSALTIFPAIYFPPKLKLITGFIRDQYFWNRYQACKDKKCKKEVLRNYSEWVQKERLFIPVNTVLKVLGQSGIPIGSINLVPFEAKPGTPSIYHNFKPLNQNVLVLALRNVDFDFKDVFPERGKNFEETKEILSSYFALKEEVTIIKEGIVISEINEKPVRQFIKGKFNEWIEENEFIDRLEKGDISTITPFGLALISKKTFGVSVVGLTSFPLNFYPYYLDLKDFFDRGLIIGEVFSENPEDFIKFDINKSRKFVIFVVDSTTLLAYRGHVYRLHEYALSNFTDRDWVMLFTTLPSGYFDTRKRLLSEIDRKLHFFGSGTSFLLSF